MKNILKHTLYSILLGGFFLFLVLIYIISPWQSTGTKRKIYLTKDVVRNFKDCKAKGFEIVGKSPERCRAPSGIVFINIEEMLAATTTDVTSYKQRR
jgi:hypothetical protein